LLFVPRGLARLGRVEHGAVLGLLIGLSVFPALAFHLLIHFGVPGYSFHYLPALIALICLGISRARVERGSTGSSETAPNDVASPSVDSPQAARLVGRIGGFPIPDSRIPIRRLRESGIGDREFGIRNSNSLSIGVQAALGADRAVPRLIGFGAVLAAAFWFYPTDYSAPGWRGDIDLAFCRFTRTGLKTPLPRQGPRQWRTANSRDLAGTPVRPTDSGGARRE
jgi:hypothetical protein